jgi:hypothetical protein
MDLKRKNEAISFCQMINQLINFGEQLAKEKGAYLDEVKRLRDRMTILTSTMPANYVIELIGPYLFDYREKIHSRDENFFMKGEFLDKVKLPSTERRETIEHFTSVFAHMYNSASKGQRDDVYNKTVSLLLSYIRYKKKE